MIVSVQVQVCRLLSDALTASVHVSASQPLLFQPQQETACDSRTGVSPESTMETGVTASRMNPRATQTDPSLR